MPVKRRAEKRRIEPAREAEIWDSVLGSGHDFFDELRELGVSADEYDRPDREPARAAWLAHGSRIIRERDPRLGPAWGEEQFGRPWEDRHAG